MEKERGADLANEVVEYGDMHADVDATLAKLGCFLSHGVN